MGHQLKWYTSIQCACTKKDGGFVYSAEGGGGGTTYNGPDGKKGRDLPS